MDHRFENWPPMKSNPGTLLEPKIEQILADTHEAPTMSASNSVLDSVQGIKKKKKKKKKKEESKGKERRGKPAEQGC